MAGPMPPMLAGAEAAPVGARIIRSRPAGTVAITLIVCTRNRLEGLRAAVACITPLSCREPWQLVLVDNGSYDGTGAWLQTLSAREGMQLDVVSEPRAGLSRARNAGLAQARGDIVAFTDDDCYPEPSFLNDLLDVFASRDVAFCGGRVILHDPADLPITLKASEAPEAFPPHTFLPAGAILGANMAYRREVIDAIGLFDVLLGAGSVTRSAEDVDYLLRASWSGFAGVYSPVPTVRHHHRRRTPEDARKINEMYDFGRGAYLVKHVLANDTRTIALKSWYWTSPFSSWSGVRRLIREIRGALTYLWWSLKSR